MTTGLPTILAEHLLWSTVVPGGHHWSGVLRRSQVLRLTALGTTANVAALFYRHDERSERYNMPDTLKTQHTASLTAGHVCHSDMGRVLCSIVADTVGWHDAWCGVSHASDIRSRHGESSYQRDRNAMHRNGRDGLLVELAKWGLGERDLTANVNFFSKVEVDAAGRLSYRDGHHRTGDSVELRFEMDTVVVLSTAPHPLDPAAAYAPANVRLEARRGAPAPADDPCRTQCAQNARAFMNTERELAR